MGGEVFRTVTQPTPNQYVYKFTGTFDVNPMYSRTKETEVFPLLEWYAGLNELPTSVGNWTLQTFTPYTNVNTGVSFTSYTGGRFTDGYVEGSNFMNTVLVPHNPGDSLDLVLTSSDSRIVDSFISYNLDIELTGTVAPEPSTYGMVGTTLVAFALCVVRKKRNTV